MWEDYIMWKIYVNWRNQPCGVLADIPLLLLETQRRIQASILDPDKTY